MPDFDRILALPIHTLDQSPRRIEFELLSNGARFYLVGGKDRRPHPGAAGFSPREMLLLLAEDLDLDAMMAIIWIKRRFGGGVQEVVSGTNGLDDYNVMETNTL